MALKRREVNAGIDEAYFVFRLLTNRTQFRFRRFERAGNWTLCDGAVVTVRYGTVAGRVLRQPKGCEFESCLGSQTKLTSEFLALWLTAERQTCREMAKTRGKSLSEEGEHRLAESLRAARLRPFKVNLSYSQSRAHVWLTDSRTDFDRW